MNYRIRLLFTFWIIALIYAVIVAAGNWHFSVDDVFISLRYAHNFADGKGLVWNAGERVEGYSSFLFVIILSIFDLVKIDLFLAARMLSIASWFALIIIVFSYLKESLEDNEAKFPVVTMAFILLVTNQPLLLWSLSGMETAFFTMLASWGIILTLNLLEKDCSAEDAFWAGTVLGLAALTRPEGAMFAGLAGLFGFLFMLMPRNQNGKTMRAFLFATLAFVIIFGGHLLWRNYYYGEWLPNTYYAKLYGEITEQHLQNGFRYLWDFVKAPPFLLLYLLITLPFAFIGNPLKFGNSLLVSILFFSLVYVVYSGGDWMHHARFFVPIVPIIVLLFCRTLAFHMGGADTKKLFMTCGSILILCVAQLSYYPQFSHHAIMLYTDRVAEYIKKNWPEDSLIAINMAGQIPYLTPEFRYVDMLGLSDRHIAHRYLRLGDKAPTPGHYKGDGEYILARDPDYIFLKDGFNETEATEDSAWISEREMAVLPEFKKRYKHRVVTVDFHHPSLPADEVTFSFYEKRR